MVEATATIRNAAGIHCRPSAAIVKAMKDYPGQLTVIAPSGSCDPRSIMGLLALCLEPGTHVRVQVDGPEEATIAGKLAELLETHFDFPARLSSEDTITLLDDISPHTPPNTTL